MAAPGLPRPGKPNGISRNKNQERQQDRARAREHIKNQLAMAQPITLELPASDPRAELMPRLQNAPAKHAEALLSAYEVLDGLHNRGVLELLRGALGSSDKVLEIVVAATNAPEAIRGIRNLLVITRILGSIEPELLESFARSLPEAIALTKAHESSPPGLWALLKEFTSKNSRRGLFLFGSILEVFGRNLRQE